MKTTVNTPKKSEGVPFAVYRYLIAPWVVALLPFAALFNRKLREGLRLRRRPLEPLGSVTSPIWIHASSGEFEYAKPVIRRLKETHADVPVVVTYFSPTYSKAATSFPGVAQASPLPLDLPGPCSDFLRKTKPRVLLISRTDLWPEMLHQCRRAEVPAVVFSYTQKAFRSPFKKAFTRWMLNWIDRIYCVSPADLDHVSSLGTGLPVEVMGDTRYDQVAFRLSHPKPLPEALRPRDGIPCFIAGSSWPEDEAVLLPALAPLLLEKKLKLILVPHEPTKAHLEALRGQLEALDLKFGYFSTGDAWPDEHVLVVDQVGVLAELYAWGDFAFIGGSFRKSVHSVMEALGAGLMTFVGPFHENNREALEFKETPIGDYTGVTVVKSADELRVRVREVLNKPGDVKNFSTALLSEFQSRLGATDRLLSRLEDLL